MKIIQLNCNFCGKEFSKEYREYKRKKSNGKTKFYCSIKCSSSEPERIIPILHKGIPFRFRGGENKIITVEGKILHSMKEFCRRMRRRPFEFNLTPEYLLEVWNNQHGKCKYTNVALVLPDTPEYKQSNNNYKASVDRIDSSKGYIIGNVQFTSISFNYLKNDMTELDIIEFLNIMKTVSSIVTINSLVNEDNKKKTVMDKKKAKILFFGVIGPLVTALIALYAIKKISNFEKQYGYLDKIFE